MLHQNVFVVTLFFGASILGAPTQEASSVPEADIGRTIEVSSSIEARSGEYLGGIDMDSACRDQWGTFAYVEQRDNSCNGWKCGIAYPEWVTGLYVDVNRACTKQHGVSAYGWCTTDAWGWGCYKN